MADDDIRAAEVELITAVIMSTPPDKNIILQPPIGSVKSAALVTAALQRVDRELKDPQVIWLVPNEESAIEIRDLLLEMGEHSPVTFDLGVPPSKADYIPLPKKLPVEAQNMDLLLEMGKDNPVTSDLGVPPSEDNYIPLLQKPLVKAQVIIGTPVTIHKWIVAGKLAIKDMKMLLIDDVDLALAEPGFKDKVVKIMKDISERPCPPQCQVIMCFTISSDAVEAFVSNIKQVLSEKEFLSFTLDSAKQYKVNVPNEPSKVMVINNKLLDQAGQTIVFVHTISSARMLVDRLQGNRFAYETLDGAVTQEQRDKILKKFKEKQFQVLISTKIPDWVFDPSQVGLVVFYDLSIISGSSAEADLERYSDCIGRGQFGRKGAVFNLMCGDKDKKIMENIETLNNVTEVLLDDDVQFKDALIEAGLYQACLWNISTLG